MPICEKRKTLCALKIWCCTIYAKTTPHYITNKIFLEKMICDVGLMINSDMAKKKMKTRKECQVTTV